MNSRRSILRLAPALLSLPALGAPEKRIEVTGIETFFVRATRRTAWFFVRLKTNRGFTGLGEASDAFPYQADWQVNAARLRTAIQKYFAMVENQSPLAIERYRQAGRSQAKAAGRLEATAFSAIEQALWDLSGKILGVPVHVLLGGAVRESLPCYANINRATTERTPSGFAASARQAVEQGFRTIKAAPFDGFPPLTSSTKEISEAATHGIACIEAIRSAVGPSCEILIDCHSHFDIPLAIDVARRLQPQRLGWYEEPIDPARIEETQQIRRGIVQPMAAGESLFGIEGFYPLVRSGAIETIMPDVKHCGGILEGRRIATVAELGNVKVAPHNPSGPVATAASVQWCGTLSNFSVLEYQWNEVPWRHELVQPPERFIQGALAVPQAPGSGIELNDALVRTHI